MPLNKDQIIVGAAQIEIDGVNAGYTTGGVTMRRANEWYDVDADQVAGVIRKEPIMERMFIQTTLLQATLDNIRTAMNDPTGNSWSGSGLSLGSAIPVAAEHVVVLRGKGGSGATRTVTMYRCISVDEVQTGMFRNTASVIPVGFECLKDPDHNDKFGTIVNSA